jgi:hypothetical protein
MILLLSMELKAIFLCLLSKRGLFLGRGRLVGCG